MFLAVFFTIIFALVVIAGGGFVPSHPTRYTPEFGISFSLLLGLLILKFSEYLKFKPEKLPYLSWKAISSLVIIGAFLISGLGIIAGRLEMDSVSSVLGIWSDVNRGEMWEARDSFNGLSSLTGFAITFITASVLTYLATKSKQSVIG